MIEILFSFLAILLTAFIFRRFFPSKEKIKNKSIYRINLEMNFFWLISYFLIAPLFVYFLYSFFRKIQFLILRISEDEGFDILILSLPPFILPILFFALPGVVFLFYNFFFSKKFIFSRIEYIEDPIEKQNYYRALMGCLHYSDNFLNTTKRIFEKIFKIMGIVFLILMILNIDYYIKIDKKGIYQNPWLSLGKENFYSWKEIENIYQIKGLILKTDVYKRKDSIDDFGLKISNGKDIYFSSNNFQPFNHSFKEIINFVAKRSQKQIECKIKDLRNGQYINCDREKEILKIYPLKKER